MFVCITWTDPAMNSDVRVTQDVSSGYAWTTSSSNSKDKAFTRAKVISNISDWLVQECTSDMPKVIAANEELRLVVFRSASTRIESFKTHTITGRIIDKLPGLRAKQRF